MALHRTGIEGVPVDRREMHARGTCGACDAVYRDLDAMDAAEDLRAMQARTARSKTVVEPHTLRWLFGVDDD
jgi:hypothetical protein